MSSQERLACNLIFIMKGVAEVFSFSFKARAYRKMLVVCGRLSLQPSDMFTPINRFATLGESPQGQPCLSLSRMQDVAN